MSETRRFRTFAPSGSGRSCGLTAWDVVVSNSTVLPRRVPLQWLADAMVGMINRNALKRSPSGRQGLGDFFESTAFGVYAEAELHDRRGHHQQGRAAISEEDIPAGARTD